MNEDESPKGILSKEDVYQIFANALTEKLPLPPAGWTGTDLTFELQWASSRQYEPDIFLRQRDAVQKSLYFLVDFARPMPPWINLAPSNENVREVCRRLAEAVDELTFRPQEVVLRDGTLKAALYAILEVGTCWIYAEEIERNIALRKQAKTGVSSKNLPVVANSRNPATQSALAQKVLQKVIGKTDSREQPSLF